MLEASSTGAGFRRLFDLETMPADYTSTARALALPIESTRSPSPSFIRPLWNAHSRSNSHGAGRSSPSFQRRVSKLRSSAIKNGSKIWRRVVATYKMMSPLQRILALIALILINVGGILFLIFNERIFRWLEPFGEKWKNTTGGWTILWAMVFMTAFPPVIGFGACGTIAGFVYGVWEGWLIYASATIVGSTCSLIVSRTLLRSYVEKIAAHDKRFAALTLTLKQDGVKLLCMIRLCPLPYSISNGVMSTFPTVHPAMYALATALVSPKLFVHVFIGSRMAAMANSSPAAKAINWISIIVGGLVGAFTGWYIYRRTMARAKELEAEEQANVRGSIRSTGMPPPEFHDDPDAMAAAATIGRTDDATVLDAPDYFDEEDDDSAPARGSRQYHDFTDTEDLDDDDIFGRGDGDEEEAIGLHRKV